MKIMFQCISFLNCCKRKKKESADNSDNDDMAIQSKKAKKKEKAILSTIDVDGNHEYSELIKER